MKEFRFRVSETYHYEFNIWADDEDSAREKGMELWRKATTVGQWEVPEQITEYEVLEKIDG